MEDCVVRERGCAFTRTHTGKHTHSHTLNPHTKTVISLTHPRINIRTGHPEACNIYIQTNQHTEDTHTAKDTDTHSDLHTHRNIQRLTHSHKHRQTEPHKHTNTPTPTQKHKHLMVTTVLHGLSKPCRAPRHCLRGPHNTPHNKKRSKRVCEECRLRPSLCTLDDPSTSRVCVYEQG